jgi:hypothetical protein
MMRPIYESETDRNNQAAVVAKLERAFGLTATAPEDRFAPYDAMFSSPPHRCVVEIKVRRNTRDRYPTYMLSSAKYNALCAATDTGVDALLAVQWADQLGIVKVPCEHSVSTGGRYDRGDSRDVESVVLIPTASFSRVSE